MSPLPLQTFNRQNNNIWCKLLHNADLGVVSEDQQVHMNIGEPPSRVFIPIFKLCTGKGCVLTLRLFYLTHSIKVRFTTEFLISSKNKGGVKRKLICRKSTFNTLLCKRSVGGQCLRSHQEEVPM